MGRPSRRSSPLIWTHSRVKGEQPKTILMISKDQREQSMQVRRVPCYDLSLSADLTIPGGMETVSLVL